ncbi:hypothetical protein P3L10_010269 [Capsicum annuum]
MLLGHTTLSIGIHRFIKLFPLLHGKVPEENKKGKMDVFRWNSALHNCQVMRLVDSFRPWMQGNRIMIVILMTVVDFVANCLEYSIMMM